MRVYHQNFSSRGVRPLPPLAFLGLALAGALAGFFILLTGFALVVLAAPILLGVAFYARWRLRRFLHEATRVRTAPNESSGRIIDADYRVLKDGR